MGHTQNERTTYARILHHTKFSRDSGGRVIRESPIQGFRRKSIGGGNTTDDAIIRREIEAAN
jgi:hypothetical protein